jgi:hypothetical protein
MTKDNKTNALFMVVLPIFSFTYPNPMTIELIANILLFSVLNPNQDNIYSLIKCLSKIYIFGYPPQNLK